MDEPVSGQPILRLIVPEQLHTVWAWVEPGLAAIKRKRNESWVPADVYTHLRCKTAFLLVVGDTHSFVIYQVFPGDDFRGVLQIWCAQGTLEHERQIYDELDALARRLGVARIRAGGRAGWGRRGFFAFFRKKQIFPR